MSAAEDVLTDYHQSPKNIEEKSNRPPGEKGVWRKRSFNSRRTTQTATEVSSPLTPTSFDGNDCAKTGGEFDASPKLAASSAALLNLTYDEALVALELTRQQRTQLSSELNSFRKTIDELKQQKAQLTVELNRRLQTHKEDVERSAHLQKEMDVLRSLYSEKQAENIELSARIQEVMQKLEATEQQRELKEENELLWRRIEDLKVEVEETRRFGGNDALEKMKARIRDLEALIIDSWVTRNPEAAAEQSNLEVVGMLKTILAADETSRKALSQQVASLRQNLKEARDRNDDDARALADAEVEKEKLKFQVAKLEKECADKSSETQVSMLQSSIDRLMDQVATEKHAKESVQRQLESATKEQRKLERQLEEAKLEHSREMQKADRLRKDVESRLSEVGKDLPEKLSRVEKELLAKKLECKAAQESSERLRQDCEKLKGDIEALNETIAKVTAKANKVESELNNQITQLEIQHEEELEKVKEEMSVAIAALKNTHTKLLEVAVGEAEERSRASTVAEYEKKMKQTVVDEQSNSNVKETVARMNLKINNFQKQIASLKEKNGTMVDQLSSAEKELAASKDKEVEASAEALELRQKLSTAQKRMLEMEEELDMLRLADEKQPEDSDRVRELETKCLAAESRIVELDAMKNTLQERVHESEITIRELEERLEDLRERGSVLGEGRGQQHEMLCRADSMVESPEAADLKASLAEKERELVKKAKDLAERDKEVAEKERELAEKDNELVELRKVLATTEILCREVKESLEEKEKSAEAATNEMKTRMKEMSEKLQEYEKEREEAMREADRMDQYDGEDDGGARWADKASSARGQIDQLTKRVASLEKDPVTQLLKMSGEVELSQKYLDEKKRKPNMSIREQWKFLAAELQKSGGGGASSSHEKSAGDRGERTNTLALNALADHLKVENDNLKAQIKKVEEGWRAEYAEYQGNLTRVRAQLEKAMSDKLRFEEACKLETQKLRYVESSKRSVEKQVEQLKEQLQSTKQATTANLPTPGKNIRSPTSPGPTVNNFDNNIPTTASNSPTKREASQQQELARAQKELEELRSRMAKENVNNGKSLWSKNWAVPIKSCANEPEFFLIAAAAVCGIIIVYSLTQLAM